MNLSSLVSSLVARLEKLDDLDRIAKPLAGAVHKLIPTGSLVKDTLSGTTLGHPLHPLLTDIPIGSFTSASILDVLGGERSQKAANALVGIGLIAALPTASAGLADWSDQQGGERRVGVVHAGANMIGLGFYAASFVARRGGHRLGATALGLMGMGAMTVGGYLGGHLTFVRGVGVNNAFWQEPPKSWSNAIEDNALPDRQPTHAQVENADVLLYRTDERILAIGDRCTHAGGPLHEGDVDAESLCVKCPWHQSVFDLQDGHVVHGPASAPVSSYDVRVTDGTVQVQSR